MKPATTQRALLTVALAAALILVAGCGSRRTARVVLLDLGSLMRIAAVDQAVIDGALSLPYRDFEDAVTMMAAVGAGADYIITRNPHDFQHGPLPVLAPAEFLRRL